MGNSVKGTKFKLNVNMEAIDGFHLSDIDFEIEVFTSSRYKVQKIPKPEAIKVDDDNYIIRVDTNICGSGDYYMTLTAYIPDTDFEEGVRTEVKTAFTGVTIDAR